MYEFETLDEMADYFDGLGDTLFEQGQNGAAAAMIFCGSVVGKSYVEEIGYMFRNPPSKDKPREGGHDEIALLNRLLDWCRPRLAEAHRPALDRFRAKLRGLVDRGRKGAAA